jgi:hypothetical protein
MKKKKIDGELFDRLRFLLLLLLLLLPSAAAPTFCSFAFPSSLPPFLLSRLTHTPSQLGSRNNKIK